MLHLTSDPGFEDLALAELQAMLPGTAGELRPDGLAGHLVVETDEVEAVCRMRSINRVVRLVARFRLPERDTLAYIRAKVAELTPSIPELAPEAARFRATCSRVGTHPYTSEDVAREAGAGVRDVLPRLVSLKEFDVELRCDVRGDTCVVGVQLPRPARPRPAYRPTTTLRPSVAWGLLQLARPTTPPRRLLDPFVGAGTLLTEAAARWPDVQLLGSDLHVGAVEGARQNLGDRAELRLGDARQLDTVWPEGGVDTLVSNPPFGRRLARQVDLEALYRSFLASAARVATADARMVVLVEQRAAFNRALRAWRTVHVRVVEMGGLYLGVFVLERA